MLTLFLSALAVGILWGLWFLPRGKVRPDYPGWMSLAAFAVLAALLGLGWSANAGWDGRILLAALGALLLRLSLFFGDRWASNGLWTASLLGGVCLAQIAQAMGAGFPGFLTLSLSALVLGTALDAMVLGHWYLVQHGLSFEPLERMSRALMGVLAARLAFSLWCLFRNGAWARLQPLDMDAILLLSLRGLLGFAGPLALGWMVLACVRIRSNTSATGILYVICLFVLVGEFASIHLLERSGICL